MARKLTYITLGCLLFTCWQQALCRPPNDTEFNAANHLAKDIANWIGTLPNKPESIAVYSVDVNEPFDHDFSNIFEVDLMKFLSKQGLNKVSTCIECRTPHVTVHQSEVIISKGAPDVESIMRVGKRLPVASLLMIEIFKTEKNLVAHAILYANPEGHLLGTDRFKIPLFEESSSSVEFLLTFGSGKTFLQGGGSPSSGGSLTGAGNLYLLEELGFGKGGLALGAVILPGSTVFYLNPTLGLRGRYGASYLGWGFNIGAGYGVNGSNRGITASTSYELFVGSWAVLGVEGTYFFANSSASDAFKAYIGLHIGLVIGR